MLKAIQFSSSLIVAFTYVKEIKVIAGAPNDNFRKIICLEDDLRSRIFGSFSEKFLACLPRICELQKNRIIAHF